MIGTFSVTWRLTSTSFSKETPNLDINTCFDVHKKTVVLPWNYYHGSPLPQHTKSVTELCRDGERQRMWKLLSHVWLCEPVDCVVRGILQARILVWVASPFSRVSSQPRDWTQVSRIADGFLTSWARREAWDREWIVQIVCLCQSCEFHSLTHPKASKENLKENRLQQLKAPAK